MYDMVHIDAFGLYIQPTTYNVALYNVHVRVHNIFIYSTMAAAAATAAMTTTTILAIASIVVGY